MLHMKHSFLTRVTKMIFPEGYINQLISGARPARLISKRETGIKPFPAGLSPALPAFGNGLSRPLRLASQA